MTRYFGKVGYGFAVENPSNSGVWEDTIVEKSTIGDVIRSTRKLDGPDKLNQNIVVDNSISMVASTYALGNWQYIKYAMLMGVRWTVTHIEVRRPRLILTLGAVYNGPIPAIEVPDDPTP